MTPELSAQIARLQEEQLWASLRHVNEQRQAQNAIDQTAINYTNYYENILEDRRITYNLLADKYSNLLARNESEIQEQHVKYNLLVNDYNGLLAKKKSEIDGRLVKYNALVNKYNNLLDRNKSEIEKLQSEVDKASILRHGHYVDNNSIAAAIYEKLGPEMLDDLMAIASEIEWAKKAL